MGRSLTLFVFTPRIRGLASVTFALPLIRRIRHIRSPRHRAIKPPAPAPSTATTSWFAGEVPVPASALFVDTGAPDTDDATPPVPVMRKSLTVMIEVLYEGGARGEAAAVPAYLQ